MVKTDLKTSFQKLQMEVFKLNDRVRMLDMFAGQRLSANPQDAELYNLLMNDVLVSIKHLTDEVIIAGDDANICGLYENLEGMQTDTIIEDEYQSILNLSRGLEQENFSSAKQSPDPDRTRTIRQAGEVAAHLKSFTELLRPRIDIE